jgi:hypothetical protein
VSSICVCACACVCVRVYVCACVSCCTCVCTDICLPLYNCPKQCQHVHTVAVTDTHTRTRTHIPVSASHKYTSPIAGFDANANAARNHSSSTCCMCSTVLRPVIPPTASLMLYSQSSISASPMTESRVRCALRKCKALVV